MPAHIIYKKGNGKNGWYLADGYTVKSLKTKSKRLAEAKLKEYNRGRLSLESEKTVKEFYDEWIERQVPPLVRPSRARDHRQCFRRHILPRFGATLLTNIRLADLRDWRADLLKTKIKTKTARNIIDSSFRAMYRDARGEIEALEGKDPFVDLKWPKAKLVPPDPLSLDEKNSFFLALPSVNRGIIHL